MMVRSLTCISASLLVLTISPLTLYGQGELVEARQKIIARHESLQSVLITYEVFMPASPVSIPRGEAKGRRGVVFAEPMDVTTREQFWFLRGNVRWEIEFSAETRQQWRARNVTPVVRWVLAHRDEQEERLNEFEERSPAGVISQRSGFGASFVEIALGLRAHQARQWLAPLDWNEMEMRQIEDGNVLLTRVNARGLTEEWLVSPALDHAITRFRTYLRDGRRQTEITAGDFREINGIMVPFLIIQTALSYVDGGPREVVRFTATVIEYRIDDPTNTDERYTVQWPPGTRITDSRTGASWTVP